MHHFPKPRAARAPTVLVAVIALAPLAHAQESMNTAAATMPSPGTFVLKPRVHYAQYGRDPNTSVESTRILELDSELTYGLARAWAMTLTIPAAYREQDHSDDSSSSDRGVGDLDLLFKWRIFKRDDAGLDTARVALLGGASFASGDDHDFSSQTISPFLGIAATIVRGRHGFNQELTYQLNNADAPEDNFGGEGGANTLFHNTSYVHRLWPDTFTPESQGAWYATAEINGILESNGDHEIRFAPGVMYEAWRWTFECMLQLPLWHDLDHRPELDWGVGLGLRLSF
jgi:hypothetical protein